MNERISLTELQLIIKDSLYMALPDMYWVIAEIAEIKVNYNGHCYLELIEKQIDNVSISARARGVIWNNRFRFIKPFFENSTGESLREGLKILLRAKIEYHEIYGLSLVINDIDPAFTMGEMALRRQQIIKRLEQEGVLTMNKDLDFPSVPQRIAVISSSNAAGYNDFITQLRENSFGYVFYTALFDTPMQGTDTQTGVIRSLERIALNTDKFDIVVIIRGGGSQADLSWFDNYDIAYFITQFPVPVLTGIGHEKDLSVTDMVAWQALKTPTAVADFLIECMTGTEDQLNEMGKGIIEMASLIVEKNKTLVESSRLKLIPLAKMSVSESRNELSDTILDMINTGKEYLLKASLIPENQRSRLISGSVSWLSVNKSSVAIVRKNLTSCSDSFIARQKNEIAGFESMLKALDPDNVLKRGYTITSLNGKIIKSGSELSKDDIIDTRFADRSVSSKVV